MKTFLIICSREWKSLTRNYGQLCILVLFAGAALYAVHYGNAVIDRQAATIQYIRAHNAASQQELAAGLQADTTTSAGMAAWEKAAYPSKVRFFLPYYAIDEPAPFARLSIGQRDVNAFYLPLNAQNLYLQLFRSEIANPRKLLAGNFDLSFVLIYLLPLLIISVGYHLHSDEQEKGTLPLLRMQPVPLHRIILCKAFFWFGITALLILGISVIAFVWSGISGMAAIGWWLLITGSYAACWFALLLLINSFRQSSAFNALFSLACWLLFLVVIPGLLNLAYTDESAADPTRLTDHIRRQQGLGNTRAEKQAVLERFYRLYPQYRPADTSAANRFFEFQAYSAYVTLTDAAAKPSVDEYYNQVAARQHKITAFHPFDPAMNTQHLLSLLGHTGLENATAFRGSIAAFHQQLCRFCFEPLFAGRLMTAADFQRIPVYKPLPPTPNTRELSAGLGWIWLLTAITAYLAWYRFRYH